MRCRARAAMFGLWNGPSSRPEVLRRVRRGALGVAGRCHRTGRAAGRLSGERGGAEDGLGGVRRSRGVHELSESRDPEDVRELLCGYFDVARTVIDRYGGEVEKFIGDAVMAVWGAPKSRRRTTPSGPFGLRSSSWRRWRSSAGGEGLEPAGARRRRDRAGGVDGPTRVREWSSATG